jgi:hypothetical protein
MEMPRIVDMWFGEAFAQERDELIAAARRRLSPEDPRVGAVGDWLDSEHPERTAKAELRRQQNLAAFKANGTPESVHGFARVEVKLEGSRISCDRVQIHRLDRALSNLVQQNQPGDLWRLLGLHLKRGQKEVNALRVVVVTACVIDPDAEEWLASVTPLASCPWHAASTTRKGKPRARRSLPSEVYERSGLCNLRGKEALALLREACRVLGWLADPIGAADHLRAAAAVLERFARMVPIIYTERIGDRLVFRWPTDTWACEVPQPGDINTWDAVVEIDRTMRLLQMSGVGSSSVELNMADVQDSMIHVWREWHSCYAGGGLHQAAKDLLILGKAVMRLHELASRGEPDDDPNGCGARASLAADTPERAKLLATELRRLAGELDPQPVRGAAVESSPAPTTDQPGGDIKSGAVPGCLANLKQNGNSKRSAEPADDQWFRFRDDDLPVLVELAAADQALPSSASPAAIPEGAADDANVAAPATKSKQKLPPLPEVGSSNNPDREVREQTLPHSLTAIGRVIEIKDYRTIEGMIQKGEIWAYRHSTKRWRLDYDQIDARWGRMAANTLT